MLEVRQLHLWRGDRHLLKGLNLGVIAGQALQLLWPNGTGKTSLLRCVAGLLHAEQGEILWNGVHTTRDPVAFHQDLAYLGHEPALKADLSAAENLRFALALRRRVTADEIQAALAAAGLGAMDPELPVRSCSAGQRKRVALARLSLWGASLWLLDEPAANLDAAGQAVLASVLNAHLSSGGSVLLATHQAITLDASSWSWSSPERAP